MTNLPTIRELNTPKATLDKINELLGNNGNGEKTSKYFIGKKVRNILGHTVCICGSIPTLQVTVIEHDMKIISHWCKSCWESNLQRQEEESQSEKSIEEYYGCTIAPEGTFGRSKKEK